MKHSTQLLTKIAVLYYQVGLTQEEVASRLGLSRQTVGRCLQQARRQKLVQVSIQSPLFYCTELEMLLEQKFALLEAIVVSPLMETENSIKEALGAAAAEFIERRVLPGEILGVAWSSSVLACAEGLSPVKCADVTVVQLNGSLDRAAYSTRAEVIGHHIAQAFSGKQVTIAAPLVVDRPDILTSLASDTRIASALDLAHRATFAVFGIGDISTQSSLYKTGYMDEKMLVQLRAAGAVGEICGRYFNEEGEICLPEVDERTLAITLSSLQRKRISMAIAGMPHKAQAIRAALRAGYCNVLVTDEATAKMIAAAK